MSIAEILVLLSAIFSASAAYVFYREARKYKGLYEDLERLYNNVEDKMFAYNEMSADIRPGFCLSYVDYGHNNTYHGKRLAVVRCSRSDRYYFEVVIKVFTDDDEEYNQRCAEELLEKLTEK